jgi:hypothetical protein
MFSRLIYAFERAVLCKKSIFWGVHLASLI